LPNGKTDFKKLERLWDIEIDDALVGGRKKASEDVALQEKIMC
jgi:hypothetical protein